MPIDKTIKKKVIEDWQTAFPQLTLYAKDKLYKVAGPIIIGLEFIKSPVSDSYSPYFVIYPLWKEDVKTSLDYPILLKDFKNKKGFQYDIPYEKHNFFFADVTENVKNQTLLPFAGSISLIKIVPVIDEYSKEPPLSASPHSYLQAVLQEAKLKRALFTGVEEAQNVLEQINKRNWDSSHFNACGVDVNQWLQSLNEVLTNREKFLKQIETNKQDKKISQLKSSELTA